MPDGWATAMMELVLRVNKDQAQRDINSLDATEGGRKAGTTFSSGFTGKWESAKRDALGRFTADAGKAGDQAGSQAGTSFGNSFGRLATGIVSSFITGAAAAQAAKLETAGGDAGRRSGVSFGAGFTSRWEPAQRDALGRFTADSGKAGDQAGQNAGRSFGQSFTRLAGGIVSSFLSGAVAGETARLQGRDTSGRFLPGGGGAGGAGGAGGGGLGGLLGGLLGGIGPGVLGLGVKATGIAGLGGAALGAVPALVGVAAPVGLAAVGGGATAALFGQTAAPATDLLKARQKAQAAAGAAQTPAQRQAAQQQLAAVNQQVAALDPAQRSMFTTIGKLQDMWDKFTKSFAPLFAQALAPIPGLFAQILPALHQFFTGAITLIQPLTAGIADLARSALPLLGQAFRAAGPLLQPLLTGLGQLLSGVLPGLITLLKAAAPAAVAFANFLGGLGRGLGSMFAQFAPVITQSSVLLGDILGVVTSLLPVIGQLAAIFARALAPAFTAFAAVIQSLLPVLTVIGQVVAGLASAALTDLVAAFQAVAGLFAQISPALTGFARALSGVFVMLENTGVFAILGNAIESIIAPLGQLISAILRGLTPILPPLIGFITQVSAVLATQLGRAIAAILPPITSLVTQGLALLARFLPPLLPLITQLARQLGGALVNAVIALAPSLTQLATVALQTLAIILPAILPLIETFARVIATLDARVVTDLAIALNAVITAIPPRVLSGITIAILAVAAGLRIWAAAQLVLNLALEANPIGLVIAAIAALAIGITELARHWNTVWGGITAAAAATGRFFTRLFRTQAVQDILAVWSLGLIPLAQHWTQVWAAITRTATAGWNATYRGALAPIVNWCTQSLPHALGVAISHVHQWWSDVANAFTGGWNTVWRTTVVPMENLFTRDLPSWFNIAVAAVARWWNGLYNAIRSPVARVIDSVLNGLINTFDWITSHIGLGRPIAAVHPFGLAAGGRLPGYGGGDRRPALLEDGETVVSKDDSRLPFMVAAFRAAGVPGYQAGGRTGQNPPPGRGFAAAGTAINIGGPALGPLGGIIHKVLDVGKITAAVATGNSRALTNAFSDLLGHTAGASALLGQILTQIPKILVRDAVNWIMGAGGGASGNAIADYAMSFLGRIPYVWGGTAVPGGADCCLPGDQPVLTASGLKPIIDIRPGDWVRTWDEGRPALRRVVRRSAPRRQMAYRVVTVTTALQASGNHPFLIARRGGHTWTPVDDLKIGDLAVRYELGRFRTEPVTAIEPLDETDTYDITVEGTSCFVAGGLVVHNSGFVQAIYHHFGINAPRTSEAQGAWVRRTGPQPGGLALYHSPPGGADPGHVAIVRSATQVISQGGGMGPQLIPLHALPLLWTGIPPGGLGAAGGGGATPGTMSAGAIAGLWRSLGGPAWAAANMARIAFAESGDRPSAVQQGQPPGLTGWGLYQITPTSGISQHGAFGDLLNAANNTRAAISLFASSGYGPWTSDPVGRSLARGPFGYARGGWINEPVTGVGKYTRALYNFAEHGREYVTPESGMPAGGGTGPLVSELRALRAVLDEVPARTAAGVARAVTVPQSQQATAARIGAR